jgi:hypothetical protein
MSCCHNVRFAETSERVFFVFYLNCYCVPELIVHHLPKCVPYTNHPESLCTLARITRLLRWDELIKSTLWANIFVCTFSIVLNSSTNLLLTSSVRLTIVEISVKRLLLVEPLNCSDENTWHITQRCQLIDVFPLLEDSNGVLL